MIFKTFMVFRIFTEVLSIQSRFSSHNQQIKMLKFVFVATVPLNRQCLYKVIITSIEKPFHFSLSQYLSIKCKCKVETNFHEIECCLRKCPINRQIVGIYVSKTIKTHYYDKIWKKVSGTCALHMLKNVSHLKQLFLNLSYSSLRCD